MGQGVTSSLKSAAEVARRSCSPWPVPGTWPPANRAPSPAARSPTPRAPRRRSRPPSTATASCAQAPRRTHPETTKTTGTGSLGSRGSAIMAALADGEARHAHSLGPRGRLARSRGSRRQPIARPSAARSAVFPPTPFARSFYVTLDTGEMVTIDIDTASVIGPRLGLPGDPGAIAVAPDDPGSTWPSSTCTTSPWSTSPGSRASPASSTSPRGRRADPPTW